MLEPEALEALLGAPPPETEPDPSDPWLAVLRGAQASDVRVLILHRARGIPLSLGKVPGWDSVDVGGTRDPVVTSAVRARLEGAADSCGWVVWSWNTDPVDVLWISIGEVPAWVMLLHELAHAVTGMAEIPALCWSLRFALQVWGEGPEVAYVRADFELVLADRLNAPATVEAALDFYPLTWPFREAIAAARNEIS